MSVTGLALILFLTFHGCMNVVALFSAEAYNQICELLGSNWYAIAATCALAALMCIHVIYAFILTFQNRKARGNNKYEVTDKPAAVEWASQNMLVLGIIVCLSSASPEGFLVQHDVGRNHRCGRSVLSYRWFRLDQVHILQPHLRGSLPRLDCGHLVPPHSRLLVSPADAGLERTHLVLPLEVHRLHLVNRGDGSFRHRGYRIRCMP